MIIYRNAPASRNFESLCGRDASLIQDMMSFSQNYFQVSKVINEKTFKECHDGVELR